MCVNTTGRKNIKKTIKVSPLPSDILIEKLKSTSG